jgi:hypothetical protein
MGFYRREANAADALLAGAEALAALAAGGRDVWTIPAESPDACAPQVSQALGLSLQAHEGSRSVPWRSAMAPGRLAVTLTQESGAVSLEVFGSAGSRREVAAPLEALGARLHERRDGPPGRATSVTPATEPPPAR